LTLQELESVLAACSSKISIDGSIIKKALQISACYGVKRFTGLNVCISTFKRTLAGESRSTISEKKR
jgi:hypothetical protein